jgi:hypothetical protein
MDIQSAKHGAEGTLEFQCVVCGAISSGLELCKLCERRGLSPAQYAEFFWEEA